MKLSLSHLVFLNLVAIAAGQACRRRDAPATKSYKIGVLAILGVETAFAEYNQTFSQYLTHTAGQQFDPPISFEMEAVAFGGDTLDEFQSGEFDFFYANPSLFSCVQSESGASPVATIRARRVVDDQDFILSQFGGVIFTLASNDEINTIEDLKDKRVGVVSMSGLGSGLMQFAEMQNAGLHHLQYPGQVIFLGNQRRIVNAVLREEIDVGFVRTDMLERSKDPSTGEQIDLSLIKIIGAKKKLLLSNGEAFPFQASTPLYPEWNLASFPQVPSVVTEAVQEALYNMDEHAKVAPGLLECIQLSGCDESDAACQDSCFQSDRSSLPCDASPQVALLARDAMKSGRHAGWRSPLSYMSLRAVQERTAFLDTKDQACARASSVSDAITCPPGHFKRSNQDIFTSCEQQGLDCYGFSCVCKPCVEAFEVDFFPVAGDGSEAPTDSVGAGCAKFAVCGTVPQGHTITFHALDNFKRANSTFTARALEGSDETLYSLSSLQSNGTSLHGFDFDATSRRVGFVILEVFVDGEQIPESPFRVEVTPRDCEADTDDPFREPDTEGNCVCNSSSIEMGSTCFSVAVVLAVVIGFVALVAFVGLFLFIRWKRKQMDAIWKVKIDELKFADPPHILGQGTFGQVLLAEYRGTDVAVKRVLPPLRELTKSDRGRLRSRSRDSNESLTRLFGTKQEQAPEEDTSNLGTTSGFHGLSSVVVAVNNKKSFQHSRSNSKFWSSRKAESNYNKLKKDFIEEMRLLSTLRHPCITTVMGAVISPTSPPMLIMEHMELGSLNGLLHNETMVLDGEVLIPMIQDIAKGLRFLHAANPQIIHGDLKSSNVLVDSKFKAKVADFGLSQKNNLRRTATGTPYWMAPELLRNEGTNTPASDVYAFGIILYEIFARKDPYEDEDPKTVLLQVADDSVAKRPPVPSSCPGELASLYHSCIDADISVRPRAHEIDEMVSSLSTDIVATNRSVRQSKNEAAHARANALLWQVFPKHVAEALRDGRKVEPEHHDDVTVFFADIVGYTAIASSQSAAKTSDLLDRLYHKFDSLCDSHKLWKVETIGDSWMGCANLVQSQPDHVARVARFAVGAIMAASSTLVDPEDASKGCVQIRVGIHCGPIVSHVVGSRMPRYSLIGDTVNYAARLESTSIAGRIHCSEEVADVLEAELDFRLICRGLIHMKGKGDMTTFWAEHESVSSSYTEQDVAPPTTRTTHRSVSYGWEVSEVETAYESEEHSEGFSLNDCRC